MTWVIAYDVTVNRTRTKIAKQLESHGIRLQKSVFLVEGPASSVLQLARELADLMDEETDRVCAWPLARNWQDTQLCFPAEATPLQEIFVVA